MKWTEDQRTIIDIRGKNILVSAAAGSGKTAVLVERIKDLVINDRVPLKSMLIVTFTNAAAGEMKQRIIDSINRELRKNEDDFLREQIQNIYTTHISTFHAFAISILKRYYYTVDINPSFNICPENQLELFKNEALDTLLENEFERQHSDFISFMRNYSSSKNEDSVRNMIISTYDFIMTLPDPEEWLEKSVNALKVSTGEFMDTEVFQTLKAHIAANLKRALAKNEGLISFLKDKGVFSLAGKAAEDTQLIKQLIQILTEENFTNFLSFLESASMQRFASTKEEKEIYDLIRDKVKKKRDSIKKDIFYSKVLFPDGTVKSRVTELNETYPHAQVLKELVLKFARIFKTIKEREEVLDFSDIEHLGLKALSNEDVASEYRKKFEYIFIDEYQDTNSIQEAFIDRVKRDDNLFMVGDVKQSIYKFRRAEPSIFLNRYREYGEEKEKSHKIDLNRNFRSKENIINCINQTFMHIMEHSLSGMNYDENAFLYRGLEYERRWDIPVDFYLIDSGKKKPGDFKAEEFLESNDADERINEILEAELEADKIAEIIKAELGTRIFDVKRGIDRSLEYRDIVILLRTVKNNASIIYETLMKHGIPAFSDGGEDYLSTVEIETFLNLLRVIDNRRQDVPLVSAMHSPVFDFTAEELIRIRLLKKNGHYYTAFLSYIEDGADEELRQKCLDMNQQIDRWKKDESFMALDDFLWKLMYESGYYNYAGALTGGEQRRANLRALIDRASDYSDGRIRGLFGFINYMDTVSKNDIGIGQIKLLSENDNVVRINSVHKSKGLEYPYVILARLGKRFNKNADNSKVKLNRDLGLALQWENYELNAYKKTLLSMIIKESADMDDLAEEIRILYVAMTRAMDKLIMTGSINTKDKDIMDILADYQDMDPGRDLDIKSASSYLTLLLPLVKGMSIDPVIIRREEIADSMNAEDPYKKYGNDVSERIRILKSELIQSDHDIKESHEIARRLNFEYPYKNTTALKSKYSVTQLNDIEKEPKKIMTFGLGDDRISDLMPGFLRDEIPATSSEKGTVLHTVLENLDFGEAVKSLGDPDYLEDFLDKLCEEQILTVKERSSVDIHALDRFTHSDIIKRAARSDCIYKERPFNLMKEIDGERIMVQGIIDCYFEEDDEFVILDYKSGYARKGNEDDKKRLVSRYENQLRLYRDALHIITGKKVKATYLYLTGTGETVNVPG